MEEDEDVTFTNSPLYQYLKENQIGNFESCEPAKPVSTPVSFPSATTVQEITIGNYKFYIYFVHKILESELLFQEDYDIVEMCILNENINSKPSISQITTIGISLCSALMLYSNCRHLISNKVTIIVTSIPLLCVAWNHFVQYRCKANFSKMLQFMKDLRILVRKILKVYLEYSMILRGIEICNQDETLTEKLGRNTNYINEKNMLCLRKIISILSENCNFLLKILSEKVPSIYTSSYEMDLTNYSSEKLYNIYLLKQSEFLRLLALSLFPKYWSSNSEKNCQFILVDLIPNISKEIQLFCEQLTLDYNIFKELSFRRKFMKKYHSNWPRKDIYVNAHNTALRVHILLNNLWNVVDKLEENDFSPLNADQIQEELREILRETEAVNTFIQIATIKLNQIKGNVNEKIEIPPLPQIEPTQIDLMSHEDEPRPFEMYELIVSKNDPIEASETFDEEESVLVKKNMSKIVMTELKTALLPRKTKTEQQEKALSKFAEDQESSEEDCQVEPPVPARRSYMMKYKRSSEESDEEEDFVKERIRLPFNPIIQREPVQFLREESFSTVGELSDDEKND